MLIISLRQFQLKAKTYLKELPLTLTIYGKPMATVNTIGESVNIISTMPVDGGNEKIEGWCQLHFEKGVKYPLSTISWEDENGIVVIDKKLACPKCVEKYEKIGRGKVYYEKIK